LLLAVDGASNNRHAKGREFLVQRFIAG
jgi:hypothetical protein